MSRHRASCRRGRQGPAVGFAAAIAVSSVAACLADNPDAESEEDDDTDTDDGSDTGDDGPGEWPTDGILACPAGDCTFLFVAETLDDRVEIFAPTQEPAYLGTLNLDLKPNPDGDTSQNQLDEPYEMAVAAGRLAMLVGHYPSRQAGSVLEVPLEWLSDHEVGQRIAVDEYFSNGAFQAPVQGHELGEMEAIFAHLEGERLWISAFANDLFAAETSWTNPAVLLQLDMDALGAEPVRAALNDVGGEVCQAGGQIVPIGGGRLAVACDGNEAVAIVEDSEGEITGAALCPIPVEPGLQTRYLASHGDGTFAVVVSPAAATADVARVWIYNDECEVLAPVSVVPGGVGTLNQIVAWPGEVGTYLVAGTLTDLRGIHVVRGAGVDAAYCGSLAGFDGHWVGADENDIEPHGLSVAQDGLGLAVGAGPFGAPSPSRPGYGKVLWATLAAAGECGVEVQSVVDLTDGAAGHADLSIAEDPATWRRGPNVLELVHVP